VSPFGNLISPFPQGSPRSVINWVRLEWPEGYEKPGVVRTKFAEILRGVTMNPKPVSMWLKRERDELNIETEYKFDFYLVVFP